MGLNGNGITPPSHPLEFGFSALVTTTTCAKYEETKKSDESATSARFGDIKAIKVERRGIVTMLQNYFPYSFVIALFNCVNVQCKCSSNYINLVYYDMNTFTHILLENSKLNAN